MVGLLLDKECLKLAQNRILPSFYTIPRYKSRSSRKDIPERGVEDERSDRLTERGGRAVRYQDETATRQREHRGKPFCCLERAELLVCPSHFGRF